MGTRSTYGSRSLYSSRLMVALAGGSLSFASFADTAPQLCFVAGWLASLADTGSLRSQLGVLCTPRRVARAFGGARRYWLTSFAGGGSRLMMALAVRRLMVAPHGSGSLRSQVARFARRWWLGSYGSLAGSRLWALTDTLSSLVS